MSDGKTFFSNAVGVTGFLGGITFATMILLIQSETKVVNHEYMIPGTAIISVLFIISTIGNMHVSHDSQNKNNKLQYIMGFFAQLGFFGLMVIIPTLVYPFSPAGSVILVILEAIMIFLFFVFRNK